MEKRSTGDTSPAIPPEGPSPSETKKDPSAEEKETRRRRREIVLIFVIFLILIALSLVEFSFGRFHTGLPFNDTILFFSIININILLILLMIFLIVRNLVKLIFERRRRILGARLRTKLVAAFVLLSLVPTAILFYVAWSFISRSIEMWVHVQVERALEGALSVSRSYYTGRAEEALYFTKQIGQTLQREGLLDREQRDHLKEFLRLQQIAYRMDAILILAPGPKQILSVFSQDKMEGPFLPENEGLLHVWKGQEINRIREVGAGVVIEAIVPVSFREGETTRRAALVVQNHVPLSLVEKMAQIARSLERHQQMMLFKYSFKSVFFMALIMVTLLILFAATWFGFFLAKGITIPIQHLAEGIRKVAAGNLTHRIERGSDDEMGILVESYNTMIDDLKRKGEEVAEAQSSLHQSNEELEQRRRYMEILFRNVGAGVLSLDQEGRIQTLNRFMEKLFTVKASEFLGKPYPELFHAEAMRPIRDLIKEVNRTKAINLERQIHVTLNQEPKNLLVRTGVLKDEADAWVGVVMVFEDHSELIRAQRAAAWREVARRIAHEIKNPLTPIQLSAQRLQKRYQGKFEPDGKVFEECTDTIIRQVEEMKNIVNEFSQFARMPATKPVLCDLNEIVQQVITLYSQVHRDVSFPFTRDESLPRLLLDPDQIRRALTNLLDNAVDATGKTGEVHLQTRYETFLRIAILEVADNGSGIPKEMRDRIFEPYASTKRGGTGLGLVIVKTIVTDHNGYIRVRDNTPRGTRFLMEFPVPLG